MQSFDDRKGRTWTITIDVTAIKRVKALCRVDLLTAVGGDLVQQLVDDPELLANVLYSLCLAQAERDGITDEQFGEGLAGEAIDRAVNALLEELVDFFPAAKGVILRKTIAKYRTLEELAGARLQKALDDPMIENRVMRDIDAALLKSFGDSSTDSPESPE